MRQNAVRPLSYRWFVRDAAHELELVPVPGTAGRPFPFGAGERRRPVEIRDFHMATTPVTQALWAHVMGANPAVRPDLRCPVENVSWDDVTGPGGFLDRLNASAILPAVASGDGTLRFRLPSETEWEYAARGGPRWTDGYTYSGGDDVDAVAWYGTRYTRPRWRLGRLFGRRFDPPTRTHDVAMKSPNQLGLYDMSGNVWEWCADGCVDDLDAVPDDGTPWVGPGPERRLRGGCHHNWDIHCTVSHRYGIERQFHDGCIGFRVVLAAP